MDLEEIGFRLPDEYKEPLSANLDKRLEYEFHSCGYNSLIEVITALRTVCGHLTKVIIYLCVSQYILNLLFSIYIVMFAN